MIELTFLLREILIVMVLLETTMVIFLGAFASFLGVSNSLIAELSGVISAIEFAYDKSWHNIWLETDSTTLVKTFNPPFKVFWKIRNRWINCINLVSNWNFVVSNIFREGNTCADSLTNIWLTITNSTHFTSIPLILRADFVKNMLNLSLFKFVSTWEGLGKVPYLHFIMFSFLYLSLFKTKNYTLSI